MIDAYRQRGAAIALALPMPLANVVNCRDFTETFSGYIFEVMRVFARFQISHVDHSLLVTMWLGPQRGDNSLSGRLYFNTIGRGK